MKKKKSLLALIGTATLVLALSFSVMQCAPAEEIQYGGRLNIGMTDPLTSLAQTGTIEHHGWGALFNLIVYDNLEHFNLPPDYYKFNPRLVQSYETSEDGKTWTLHLVKNARWHDGEPVTAEDVKFTCEYLISTPGWADVDVCFDHIEIIDDYTLKIVNTRALTRTNAPGWWCWDPIIPKHIFEPYKDDVGSYPNKEAIGSGPFKLKEFKSGQYMWLVANKDYWGGRPYLDEVVFRYYGSMDTLLMALKSGEIDVELPFLPASSISDLEANPDINVEPVPGLTLYWLSFNLHKDTPLQDKNVRKAIQYGVNRDRIVDMVYMGHAKKYDSWVYEEDPMHNPNLPQYDYNPDKANKILDEAGYIDTDGDGIREDPATGKDLAFELLTYSDVSVVKMAKLIKEDLPEIGISVNIATLDYDTFADTIYYPTEDKYEIAISREDPSPSPYGDWIWLEAKGWGALGDGTEWNSSYWDNPRFNELTNLVTTAKSMEERREYEYEMQELMAEELPYAFLVRPQFISVWRTDKFEGWKNEVGGPVSWMNPWSILSVHLKGATKE